MKNFYVLFIIVLIVLKVQTAFSQSDTILIDLGSFQSKSPWNNLVDPTGEGEIANLINSDTVATNVGLKIYSKFSSINTTGTTTPDPSIGFPSKATEDSYYVMDPVTTGSIRFTGFNPKKTYKFILFASRAGVTDNREAKYLFEGNVKDSLYLDSANNTDKTVETSLKPKADGTINLITTAGPHNTQSSHLAYLGAIKIIYDTPTTAITTIGNNKGMRVYPNPYADNFTIEFETASVGKVEIRFIDLTGRQVGIVENPVSNGGFHSLTFSNAQINSKSAVIYGVVKIEDKKGMSQSTVKLMRMKIN